MPEVGVVVLQVVAAVAGEVEGRGILVNTER
jgi:hypothetical protein